jgi:hypothetical protein
MNLSPAERVHSSRDVCWTPSLAIHPCDLKSHERLNGSVFARLVEGVSRCFRVDPDREEAQTPASSRLKVLMASAVAVGGRSRLVAELRDMSCQDKGKPGKTSR